MFQRLVICNLSYFPLCECRQSMVYTYYSISTTVFPIFFFTLRFNEHENTNGGNDNMQIEEFDTVLLKDGQSAAIVDKLSEDTFIADIEDSPEDWDTITITIDEIEKVVYRSTKSIDR